jgi:hypothetical protein
MTTDGFGADTPQETAAGEIKDEKEDAKYALVLTVCVCVCVMYIYIYTYIYIYIYTYV